jgi:hypothetical protein
MAASENNSKLVDDAISSVRSLTTSCLVFYLVFVFAFPKLLDVNDEERAIPEFTTWLALSTEAPQVVSARKPETELMFPGLESLSDTQAAVTMARPATASPPLYRRGQPI